MTRQEEQDALAGLESYEMWRRRRGLGPAEFWRQRLQRAGVTLPPPPEFEPGDAFEGDET
jgi:hypothetical protein